MIESYRIKQTEFLSGKEAPYLLRLMMAFDSIRSAYRWVEHTTTGDDLTPERRSDQLMALIACCGWAWAAVELVRDGKNRGWLRREMLSDRPDLEAIWDELTGRNEGERLKRMRDIRNHCFGHFDARTAQIFLDRHRKLESEDIPPFLETSDGGKMLRTRYPWAYIAFATHLYPHPFDLDEAQRRIGDTVALTKAILQLLHHFVTVYGLNAKLVFEQVEDASANSDRPDG